jgi:hypothetical protein
LGLTLLSYTNGDSSGGTNTGQGFATVSYQQPTTLALTVVPSGQTDNYGDEETLQATLSPYYPDALGKAVAFDTASSSNTTTAVPCDGSGDGTLQSNGTAICHTTSLPATYTASMTAMSDSTHVLASFAGTDGLAASSTPATGYTVLQDELTLAADLEPVDGDPTDVKATVSATPTDLANGVPYGTAHLSLTNKTSPADAPVLTGCDTILIDQNEVAGTADDSNLPLSR